MEHLESDELYPTSMCHLVFGRDFYRIRDISKETLTKSDDTHHISMSYGKETLTESDDLYPTSMSHLVFGKDFYRIRELSKETPTFSN